MEFLFELNDFNNIKHLEKFFKVNGIENFKIKQKKEKLEIYLDKTNFKKEEIDVLKRHLSFYDIFFWSGQEIENVTLWEKPVRIKAVLEEFEALFKDISYDAITSIEARGFILGGIFIYKYQKPFIPIRKYKKLYKDMEGIKSEYVNWKDQKESLFVFNHSLKGKKVIFVDDILDTGRSLQTTVNMLERAGINIVGAFYLMDNSKQEIKDNFNFPIRSLLRFKNIFELRD